MTKEIEKILKEHTWTANSFIDKDGNNHWKLLIKDFAKLVEASKAEGRKEVQSIVEKNVRFLIDKEKTTGKYSNDYLLALDDLENNIFKDLATLSKTEEVSDQ